MEDHTMEQGFMIDGKLDMNRITNQCDYLEGSNGCINYDYMDNEPHPTTLVTRFYVNVPVKSDSERLLIGTRGAYCELDKDSEIDRKFISFSGISDVLLFVFDYITLAYLFDQDLLVYIEHSETDPPEGTFEHELNVKYPSQTGIKFVTRVDEL